MFSESPISGLLYLADHEDNINTFVDGKNRSLLGISFKIKSVNLQHSNKLKRIVEKVLTYRGKKWRNKYTVSSVQFTVYCPGSNIVQFSNLPMRDLADIVYAWYKMVISHTDNSKDNFQDIIEKYEKYFYNDKKKPLDQLMANILDGPQDVKFIFTLKDQLNAREMERILLNDFDRDRLDAVIPAHIFEQEMLNPHAPPEDIMNELTHRINNTHLVSHQAENDENYTEYDDVSESLNKMTHNQRDKDLYKKGSGLIERIKRLSNIFRSKPY